MDAVDFISQPQSQCVSVITVLMVNVIWNNGFISWGLFSISHLNYCCNASAPGLEMLYKITITQVSLLRALKLPNCLIILKMMNGSCGENMIFSLFISKIKHWKNEGCFLSEAHLCVLCSPSPTVFHYPRNRKFSNAQMCNQTHAVRFYSWKL